MYHRAVVQQTVLSWPIVLVGRCCRKPETGELSTSRDFEKEQHRVVVAVKAALSLSNMGFVSDGVITMTVPS